MIEILVMIYQVEALLIIIILTTTIVMIYQKETLLIIINIHSSFNRYPIIHLLFI